MSPAAPLPDPGNTVSSATFKAIASQYLAHNALYAENPSIHEFQFRVFVKAFGDLPFEAVDRQRIEAFFAGRRAAGTAATTCNRNRSCLLVFYRWATERGLCAESPMRLIPKFRERPKQGAVLTPAEFSAILIAASGHLRAYLLALLWTGGRRTETVRLRWRWFNPEARSITFISDDTKSKRSRTVPVPEPLYRALMALPRGGPDDRIFLYQGKPVESMRRALATACRRAGLKPIGWHVLRRSYATMCSGAGMPLQMLQDLMGHASPVTTKKYVVPSESYLRSAEAFIQRGVAGKCDKVADPLDGGA